MAILYKPDGTVANAFPANTSGEFELEELYALIGCDTIDIVPLNPRELLVVDDNGLAKKLPLNLKASALYGDMIVGNALRCSRSEVS